MTQAGTTAGLRIEYHMAPKSPPARLPAWPVPPLVCPYMASLGGKGPARGRGRRGVENRTSRRARPCD